MFGGLSLIRLVVGGVVLLAILAAGFFAGSKYERSAWVDREQVRLTQEAEAKRAEGLLFTRNSERVVEITKVITQYVDRVRVVHDVIEKRIEVYVPADTPPLPAGWRVLHDAAARGVEPDSTAASGADAAPVSAQDAARTVNDNYAECRADQGRLSNLQDYVDDVVLHKGRSQ